MSQRPNPFEVGAPAFGVPSLLPNGPFTFNAANATIQATPAASTPSASFLTSSPTTQTSFQPAMGSTVEELQFKRHLSWLDTNDDPNAPKQTQSQLQQVKDAPLFSQKARLRVEEQQASSVFSPSAFPQYGLLGKRKGDSTRNEEDNVIYANTNAPWSAFICGSQGGGKSHTLCCMLENCLLASSPVGKLQNPLAAIVFHYDKFTSHSTTQLCEAAYLCSQRVPVTVLVSPSNIWAMTKLYSNIPSLPPGGPRPRVLPLYLRQQQLNVSNMMTLMNVSDTESTPLYLEVLYKILRDMAMLQKGAPGLDYADFKARLRNQNFTHLQNGPLSMRLDLLEAFMDPEMMQRSGPRMSTNDVWDFKPGSMTIVDLSCPFVNENDACALFSICLSLFMESRSKVGRVVALDEAHKFLTQSGEAADFTDQLVSIVCQQRHLGTRVMIATQEPTLSPRLLDLCNVSIVHRFLSPAWFTTLRGHLAGAADRLDGDRKLNRRDLFESIVGLETGEALVFAPTAVLDVSDIDGTTQPMNHNHFKIRIRKRLTADGGKSIMASDNIVLSSVTKAVEIPFFLAPLAAPRSFAQQSPPRQRLVSAEPSDRATSPAISTFNKIPANKAKIVQALQDATRDEVNSMGVDRISFDAIRGEATALIGLPSGFFLNDNEWKKESKRIINAQIRNHQHKN